MRSQNTSTIERLRSLGGVFRGSELSVRFQWTSKTTSQYLYLWKSKGLVDSLGGHSDVFVNLLRNPNPDWDAALAMAMPKSVLIGIEPLRRAGWVTQIPSRPAVAVASSERVFLGIDRYEILPRPNRWFAAIQHGIERSDQALSSLRPSWALADMIAHEGWGGCGLQPDDIDVSFMTSIDMEDWEAACQALKVDQADRRVIAFTTSTMGMR